MISIEDFPNSIEDHEVYHLGVEHPGAPPGCRNCKGSHAHILHAAGDYNIIVPNYDGSYSVDDCP